MILIWGTRRTERVLGYVADYCAMCHDFRAFRLIRVGLASHLYYISFGSGKQVGHLVRCETCGVELDKDPTRYATFVKTRPAELSELIRSTCPALPSLYAEQVARDAEVRRNPHTLPNDQRETLLLDPFRLLHPKVEARYAVGTAMDKPAGIGCFGTILATVLVIVAISYLKKGVPISDGQLITILTVFGLGGLYTFIQIGFAPGRFMRLEIIPKIARALAPFHPTEAELQHCLDKCRSVSWLIGKKIKTKQILAEIERQQTPLPRGF